MLVFLPIFRRRGTYPHIPPLHLDEYATESSVDKKGTEIVGCKNKMLLK